MTEVLVSGAILIGMASGLAAGHIVTGAIDQVARMRARAAWVQAWRTPPG